MKTINDEFLQSNDMNDNANRNYMSTREEKSDIDESKEQISINSSNSPTLLEDLVAMTSIITIIS